VRNIYDEKNNSLESLNINGLVVSLSIELDDMISIKFVK